MQASPVIGFAAETSKPSSRTLFLIVEDDPSDFLLLDRALRKLEVTVRVCWAQSGAEAIETFTRMAAKYSTICVVLDVQLPDMDGFELLEELKARISKLRQPSSF